MRITAKGQVTIPREVRERAGLMPGTDVEFEREGAMKTTDGPDLASRPSHSN